MFVKMAVIGGVLMRNGNYLKKNIGVRLDSLLRISIIPLFSPDKARKVPSYGALRALKEALRTFPQSNSKLISFLFLLSIFFIAFPLVIYRGVATITITEILFSLTFLIWLNKALRSPNKKIELTPLLIPMIFFY
jgi:hypothetical protein